MKKAPIYIIILLFFVCMNAQTQEILNELNYNPVIIKTLINNNQKHLEYNTKNKKSNLSLPFLDDFSKESSLPDEAIWEDNYIYINKNHPVNPITIGVATFDAIDDSGKVYTHASSSPFIADYLTSLPINLASYDTIDSVYFSFYYQPGGSIDNPWNSYGKAPDEKDSLILQFNVLTWDSTLTIYNEQLLIDTFLQAGDSILNLCDSTKILVDTYLKTYKILIPGDAIFVNSVWINIDTFYVEGDYLFHPVDSIWMLCDSHLQDKNILLSGDVVSIPCDSAWHYDTEWRNVWSTTGLTLKEFYSLYNRYFRLIMLPINDSSYFHDNFQFRFYNYASLDGSTMGNADQNHGIRDHWHIDYVYMNNNRNDNDTNFADAAFTQAMPSILKNYRSMPFNQYKDGAAWERKESISLPISNLGSFKFFISKDFRIIGPIKTHEDPSSGNFNHFYPFSDTTYDINLNKFWFLSSEEKLTEFEVVAYINDADDINHNNDTIRYIQEFSNYYAYDDGIPESSYGFGKDGGTVAYKFNLNKKDTIVGVQIYFTHVFEEISKQTYTLKIWNTDNSTGKPGDLIYSDEEIRRPDHTETESGYFTYNFDTENIEVESSFFIGIEQVSDYSINIGFDRNHNEQDKIFVYDYSYLDWNNTIYKGALMIRPLMDADPRVGIKESSSNLRSFSIQPNPCSNTSVQINLSEYYLINTVAQNNLIVEIYSITGQKVAAAPYQQQFPLTNLQEGLYLIRVTDNASGDSFSKKLIIRN